MDVKVTIEETCEIHKNTKQSMYLVLNINYVLIKCVPLYKNVLQPQNNFFKYYAYLLQSYVSC